MLTKKAGAMRISRLYTPDKLNTGQQLELQQDNAHYARTVLRLKKDQSLTLFNGLGGEFICTLQEVSRKRVVVNVVEAIDRTVESPLYVTLGLGISRVERNGYETFLGIQVKDGFEVDLVHPCNAARRQPRHTG